MNQVNRLEKSVKKLGLDLQAIVEEHDLYRFDASDEEIMRWFYSLPIETLSDSLNKDHKNPRTKYSLKDMQHKFNLKKLHEKKEKEYHQQQSKLNIARINYILAQIERIQI